jgi:hypothetical protein
MIACFDSGRASQEHAQRDWLSVEGAGSGRRVVRTDYVARGAKPWAGDEFKCGAGRSRGSGPGPAGEIGARREGRRCGLPPSAMKIPDGVLQPGGNFGRLR